MLRDRRYIRGEVKTKSDAMNPYQVMGIIACCTIVFAGVVALLAMQGVHILLALLGVYLVAVCCMLGMQRRARDSFEFREDLRWRQRERDPVIHRLRANDSSMVNRGAGGPADQLSV